MSKRYVTFCAIFLVRCISSRERHAAACLSERDRNVGSALSCCGENLVGEETDKGAVHLFKNVLMWSGLRTGVLGRDHLEGPWKNRSEQSRVKHEQDVP